MVELLCFPMKSKVVYMASEEPLLARSYRVTLTFKSPLALLPVTRFDGMYYSLHVNRKKSDSQCSE